MFPFNIDDATSDGSPVTIISVQHSKQQLRLNDTKHQLLADLVFERCRGIGRICSKLLAMSMGAMYNHEHYDRRSADQTINYLKVIKAYCASPQAV